MAPKKTEQETKSEVAIYCLKELMNVRKEPSIYAEKICTKPAGTKVEVKEIENGWLHLTDGNYILYENGLYAEKL